MRRSAGLAASLFLTALSLAGCGHGSVIGSGPLPTPTPIPPSVTNEFAIPTAGAHPGGVISSSSGFILFSEQGTSKLGQVSTGGVFTEFVLTTIGATSGNHPVDLTQGPDGKIWFTEQGTKPGVASFASNKVVEYPITGGAPTFIKNGPGPNTVVFSDPGTNSIGVVNLTTNTVAETPIPTASANPMGLAVNSGDVNNVYFTEHDASKIGIYNVNTGSISEIGTLTPNAGPTQIVEGPDHAMWFTENTVAKMGRLTLTGQMQEYPLAPATNATALVVGGDNNLYFLDPAHNAMGSFVPAPPFTVTEFKIPTANALATLPAFPGTMALGFDGRIYFPETAANKIGQFNL